jgi:hypothetical protein
MTTIHASAVLVGARATLIRGAAGSGKSSLAFALIQAVGNGALTFARLVGDDRVHVQAVHGRLLVRPAGDARGPDRSSRTRNPQSSVRARGGRGPRCRSGCCRRGTPPARRGRRYGSRRDTPAATRRSRPPRPLLRSCLLRCAPLNLAVNQRFQSPFTASQNIPRNVPHPLALAPHMVMMAPFRAVGRDVRAGRSPDLQ